MHRKVPLLIDWLGGFAAQNRPLMTRLGNLETKLLSEDTRGIQIKSPVFISGLARSGSTLLLEILNSHQDAASYSYKDFPFIHTVFFWEKIFSFWPGIKRDKRERAHQDGMMVGPDSPEAMDEMIWMSFFDSLHDPAQPNLLGADINNPAFESFYKDNIRKLLFARGKQRFISKNNYNVARLDYLLKTFPDAKIIVPFRDPASHVSSLVKQHRLFCKAQKDDPRALRYMQHCGHFEFGLDFRPVNFGDAGEIQDILNLWQAGEITQAYAACWASQYEHILKFLEAGKTGRVHPISYENLCAYPEAELAKLSEVAELPLSSGLLQQWSGRIHPASGKETSLRDGEENLVREKTEKTYESLCKMCV